MDPELRLYRTITTHLPPIKGMGVIGNIFRDLYNRRERKTVTARVLGNTMALEPKENVDSELLFYPQLYDRHEVKFLKKTLKPGDTFVDIGANVGIYSLIAAKCVGDKGTVLSIEADPYNFKKLEENAKLSQANAITALNIGVSDQKETLELSINTTGNRGGNSFIRTQGDKSETIAVECLPLYQAIKSKVKAVTGFKLDIEGFEYRVLKAFFASAPSSLWPKFIIIEHTPSQVEIAGGDAIALLKDVGYRVGSKNSMNYIMVR